MQFVQDARVSSSNKTQQTKKVLTLYVNYEVLQDAATTFLNRSLEWDLMSHRQFILWAIRICRSS